MTRFGNEIITKLCHRLFKDPTSATMDDVQKIVRGWLLASEGRLPGLVAKPKCSSNIGARCHGVRSGKTTFLPEVVCPTTDGGRHGPKQG